MPHPDEQIVAEHREVMNVLAAALDKLFNDELQGAARKTCFVLLVAPFNDEGNGRCNYISNGDRGNIILLMKEMIARFEGQPELTGTS